MKYLLMIVIALVLVVGAAVGGYWFWPSLSRPPAFRTATVTRGDLRLTISATGTVQPEEVVDVGAQVAGQIKSFGEDPHNPGRTVDYTSQVEEGTVLARIDDTLYVSDVAQAAATLEVARASEVRARADLEQLKAKLVQAENDWKRAQEVYKRPGSISDLEYDQYKAAYLTAKSGKEVGEASIVQATKAAGQAQAMLDKAKKNLSYCTIVSPVKGVIIDRRVNVGQTVVSSLNAPSLFLIAKDLKRMQVWVQVNEADIGQIKAGQAVTFTVDTFPNTTFQGVVGKIRFNATMTQNVVTYTVEVNTDNSTGKLLPYLTANLQFEVGQRAHALLVPNAALRWWPQPDRIAPDAQAKGSRRNDKGASEAKDNIDRGTIWVQDGNFVRPLRVRVGMSDGTMTEIESTELPEGTEIVVGESRPNDANGSTSNPFAPKMFGSGGKAQ